MITSPYHFVTPPAKVVTPYWAKFVSHDVPFADGLSGSIDIELVAQSPLFIGMEKEKEQKAPTQAQPFYQRNGNYVIPGSSIRGMVRSVLEIMSAGRITGRTHNQKFAQREFNNKKLYKKQILSSNTKGGWLCYNWDTNYYELEVADEVGRITHRKIDNLPSAITKRMNGYFQNSRVDTSNVHESDIHSRDSKSAKFKYELFFQQLEQPLVFLFDECGTDEQSSHPNALRNYQAGSARQGELVMTGQPSKIKHREFIFFPATHPKRYVFDNEDQESEVVDNFFSAYFDYDKNLQSPDYKWRKSQLDQGKKIPVFFRLDDENNKVLDIGLSQLYKISYDNDINTLLATRSGETDADPDLADLILGFVRPDGFGLKSRVFFQDAVCKSGQPTPQPLDLVLSSPRPTYYPNYLAQEGTNGQLSGDYTTFNNADPIGRRSTNLRGWKRYPVHSASMPESTKGTPEMTTRIHPLDTGATFVCTLQYHNLRPVELGALLSALSFHQTEGAFHQLGMGKPYGLGKVKLTLGQTKGMEGYDSTPYLAMFEAFMNDELKARWVEQPFVRELLTMAIPDPARDASLKYMDDPKKFSNAKKEKLFLKDLDLHPNKLPVSLITDPAQESTWKKQWKAEYQSKILSPSRQPAVDMRQLREARIAELEQIKKKLEEIQKTIRNREEAQTSPIDLTEIRNNARRDFTDLKKRVIDFAKKRYSCTQEQLEQRKDSWFTDDASIQEIHQTITELRARSKEKKDRERWAMASDQTYSHWASIQKWVGAAIAERWYQST